MDSGNKFHKDNDNDFQALKLDIHIHQDGARKKKCTKGKKCPANSTPNTADSQTNPRSSNHSKTKGHSFRTM